MLYEVADEYWTIQQKQLHRAVNARIYGNDGKPIDAGIASDPNEQ